jgi:uncharacterized protein
LSNYFVDSSAIAKRYLAEAGSTWVISWIEPSAGNVVIISELALAEMRSLLARRHRDGSITPSAASALRSDFLIHYRDDYPVVPVDTPIIQVAGDLLNRHKLRTLDAIQLASALHVVQILDEPMTFISADANLLMAAKSEGYDTDDPNAHP